jgi:hypothetical protein
MRADVRTEKRGNYEILIKFLEIVHCSMCVSFCSLKLVMAVTFE